MFKVEIEEDVINHIMSAADILYHGVTNALREATDLGQLHCEQDNLELGDLAAHMIVQELIDHQHDFEGTSGIIGSAKRYDVRRC